MMKPEPVFTAECMNNRTWVWVDQSVGAFGRRMLAVFACSQQAVGRLFHVKASSMRMFLSHSSALSQWTTTFSFFHSTCVAAFAPTASTMATMIPEIARFIFALLVTFAS